MFAIGDIDWPGVSKLVEECGEVQQVAGKLMGTGGHAQHWDGSHLPTELEKELGDLLAAIEFVIEHNNGALNAEAIRERARLKLRRFKQWHELGHKNQGAIR